MSLLIDPDPGLPKDCADPTRDMPKKVEAFSNAKDFHVNKITIDDAKRDIVSYTNHYHYGQDATPNDARERGRLRNSISWWLRGPNFPEIYRTSLAQRAEQTGMWFIESKEFQEFMEKPGAILWVTGMPGSGKTILSSTCTNHLQDTCSGDENSVVVCAYIRYSERHTLLEIVAGLMSQLARASDKALDLIEPYYRRLTQDDNTYLVSELLEILKKIVCSLRKVFTVIDGLDEANDEVKDGLLGALPSTGVNLLIFSRPLEMFTHHVEDAVLFSLQARNEDIRLCVLEFVKGNSRLKAILRGEPDLIQRLCDTVQERASGMFLMARLQLEALGRTCTSVASLFKTLQTFPSGLTELYRLTLERINEQPEDDVSIAHRVFTWILHARAGRKNLTAEDLRYALAVSFDSKRFNKDEIPPTEVILSACGGLVALVPVIDSMSHVNMTPSFRFIHYTAVEFMRTVELSTIPKNPHNYLAVICAAYLDYVGLPDFETTGGPKLGGIRFLDALNQFHRSIPFNMYAQWYWMYHVALAQGSLDPYLHAYFLKHPLLREGLDWLPSLHFASAYGLTEIIATRNLPNPAFKFPLRLSWPDVISTPFHFAASGGHFDAFWALVSAYPGVHIPTAHKNTFLHLALQDIGVKESRFVGPFFSRLDILSPQQASRLLPGFDVNAQNDEGQTPLMFACDNGDIHHVRMLISRPDVRLDIRDTRGRDAAHHMCACTPMAAPPELQEAIISSFPTIDLTVRDAKDGTTTFMAVCRTRKLFVLQNILADNTSERPQFLHDADNKGETAFLTCLMRYGDISYRPTEYDTVRVVQAKKMLDLLIQADPAVLLYRSREGETGLMCLANGPDPCGVEVIPFLLLQPGLDPNYVNFQDRAGRTALMHALLSFRHGPEVFSGSPHDADTHSRWQFLQVLLSSPGIDLHQRDRWGEDAVQIAYSEPWLDGWRRPSHELAADAGLPLQDNPAQVLSKLRTLLDINQCYPSRLVRRAIIRSSGMLHLPECGGDYAVCRRLMEGWVADSFIWDIHQTDTVTLLAQTAKRPCRLPIAMVLSYLGLLEPPLFPQGDAAGVPTADGVLEFNAQAQRYCGNGCSWHSVVPLRLYYDRHDSDLYPRSDNPTLQKLAAKYLF